MRREMGAGGLPVRTGDADKHQMLGRLRVHCRGERSDGPSRVLDYDQGYACHERRPLRLPVRLDYDSPCLGLNRPRDEVVSVRAPARDRREGPAGYNAPRVVRDRTDAWHVANRPSTTGCLPPLHASHLKSLSRVSTKASALWL